MTPKAGSTKKLYKLAFRRYSEFTGMAAEELIMEKWEDVQKRPIDRTDAVEQKVYEFYEWLVNDFKKAERYSKNGRRSLSQASARLYTAAIQTFYSANGVPLNMKVLGRGRISGLTRRVNETVKMTADQVQRLAYHAPTLRDKAVIWCMFQSGLDVSTALSLRWKHVMEEIEDPPMGAVMLRGLARKKTRGHRFDTFLYKTAVTHLREYLKRRLGDEWVKKMEYEDPLFVNRHGQRAGKAYPTRAFQGLLKKIAPQTNIANSRLEHADLNPLRPHSLRASFGDQMTKAGASRELKDYLMGHVIGYGGAYFGGEEGLREAYVKYAQEALEPKGVSPDVVMKVEKQASKIEAFEEMWRDERERRLGLERELQDLRAKQVEMDGGLNLIHVENNNLKSLVQTLKEDARESYDMAKQALSATSGLTKEDVERIVNASLFKFSQG